MTSRRLPLFLVLAGALAASGAMAQTPLPPSVAQGGATEPAPVPPGVNYDLWLGPAPQRGYSETLPLPRKIDRDDIADPYGGGSRAGGDRVSPNVTPSGRMGMGGRF